MQRIFIHFREIEGAYSAGALTEISLEYPNQSIDPTQGVTGFAERGGRLSNLQSWMELPRQAPFLLGPCSTLRVLLLISNENGASR